MGRVQLDRVEAGAPGTLRRGREGVDQPGDVVLVGDLDLGLAGAAAGGGHQQPDLLPRQVVRHVHRALEAR